MKRDFRSGEFVCLRCTMRIQKDVCMGKETKRNVNSNINIYKKRDGRTDEQTVLYFVCEG
jgi:hypothetical protein